MEIPIAKNEGKGYMSDSEIRRRKEKLNDDLRPAINEKGKAKLENYTGSYNYLSFHFCSRGTIDMPWFVYKFKTIDKCFTFCITIIGKDKKRKKKEKKKNYYYITFAQMNLINKVWS